MPIVTGQATARSGVTLLARILGNAGQPVTQASLTSISYTLTDLVTGLAVGTGTFAVPTAVYDNLQQQDPRWSRDSSLYPGPDGLWGYNFLAQIPAGQVIAGGHRHQCDVVFTPLTGEPFRVVFSFVPTVVYG